MTRPRNRPRVFVLEDDPDQRDLLRAFFALRGCEVEAVANLEEAREALRTEASAEHHDLYVIDYDLPDGVSFELLEEGLLDPEQTLVISASRSLPPPPPGAQHITKPASMESLTTAVGKLLWTGWSGPPSSSIMDRHSRPPDEGTDLRLVLYVCLGSDLSDRALRRLAEALGTDPTTDPRVRIVDVESTEGLTESAAEGVLFTPTLERRSPEPRAWLVGALEDPAAVRALIDG